jgi:hypothetical protein
VAREGGPLAIGVVDAVLRGDDRLLLLPFVDVGEGGFHVLEPGALALLAEHGLGLDTYRSFPSTMLR